MCTIDFQNFAILGHALLRKYRGFMKKVQICVQIVFKNVTSRQPNSLTYLQKYRRFVKNVHFMSNFVHIVRARIHSLHFKIEFATFSSFWRNSIYEDLCNLKVVKITVFHKSPRIILMPLIVTVCRSSAGIHLKLSRTLF